MPWEFRPLFCIWGARMNDTAYKSGLPRPPIPPKEPGRCVHCGCTDAAPCRFGRYSTCSWMIVDGNRRVCSSRNCVQAEIDRLFGELERRNRRVA